MITQRGTQILHTKRLTLRKFVLGDAQAMFDTWANDERVTRFLTWCPHGSVEVTKQLLEMWCATYESLSTYNWVMEFEGKIIGNISVVKIDKKSEYADLGYCMGYDYWNKGLMTEAVKAVIDYLFEEVGVHRIGICHAVKNPASGKVAQKCGLTLEGTKRECHKAPTGEFFDISDYGILQSEWKKIKSNR